MLSDIAIQRLRQVKQHFITNPHSLDMCEYLEGRPYEHDAPVNCRTTGCIAGWLCVFAKVEIDIKTLDFFCTASELLGISPNQAETLFYHSAWLPHLQHRYVIATCEDESQTKATVTAEAIEDFIARHTQPPVTEETQQSSQLEEVLQCVI